MAGDSWLNRRLPFDDPTSRLHFPLAFRALWVVAGGVAVAITKHWEIGPKGTDDIVGLIALGPIFLTAVLRVIHPGERRLRSLGPTKPGKEGPPPVTAVLRSIHDLVVTTSQDREAKLRVTLFVPDATDRLLRQFARFSAETKHVSGTTVRMGTGDVGRAFTWNKSIHVHDVNAHGGFHECMRSLGLELVEAETHTDKARRSFVSIPIVDSDAQQRFGVLSLDAAEGDFFARHKDDIDKAKRLLQGLLEQLAAAEIVPMPLPPSSVSDARDEDSNPFIRTRAESGQHKVRT